MNPETLTLKMDDGASNTGEIGNPVDDDDCSSSGVYNTANTGKECTLAFSVDVLSP